MPSENSAEHDALVATIIQLENDMMSMDGGSPEYAKSMSHLKDLRKMLSDEPKSFWSRIDPNTLIIGGVNLAGIFLIIMHERAHVITTKAIGFAGKLR